MTGPSGKDDAGKGEAETAPRPPAKGKGEKVEESGGMDDLFYKKDLDKNMMSGTEEDLWDEPDTVVAEVKKANKKTPTSKHVESDFE